MSENDAEMREFTSDADALIDAYAAILNDLRGGFGGSCVIAAAAAFEYAVAYCSLANPDRLEIFTVWNAFLLNALQRPVGHACLRYFIGDDRNDPEDYVYIDADLDYKYYEDDIQAWGHVPVDYLELDPEDPLFDVFGEQEEFEVVTQSFSNADDFKSSLTYRLFCANT